MELASEVQYSEGCISSQPLASSSPSHSPDGFKQEDLLLYCIHHSTHPVQAPEQLP